MKVIHIISGDIWAGAEVQVYNTIIALAKQSGINISCIVFNNGILKKKLEERNIQTVLLDESKYSTISLFFKFRSVIQNMKPNILHVHAVKEHFLGKFVTLSILRKIKLVRTVHGARKVSNNLPFFQFCRSTLAVNIDNLLIALFANAVIAVSKDLEKDFHRRKIKGDIAQIYNAVNTAEYEIIIDKDGIRKKFGVENCLWIGTAARLATPKNLQMLIMAGGYLQKKGVSFKISIFGEGPLRQELQSMIDLNRLSENVKLHGFESNIIPVIYSMDIFTLCSIKEGIPMALLESILLKTPVVATNVPGIREVIENGVNGLLVPLNDAKAFAESFIKLYDDNLNSRLTKNARIMLDEKFSIKKTSRQLQNVYDNILR